MTLSNTQSNLTHREEWAAMEIELLEESIANGFISSSKRAMAVQQQDDDRIVCAVEGKERKARYIYVKNETNHL